MIKPLDLLARVAALSAAAIGTAASIFEMQVRIVESVVGDRETSPRAGRMFDSFFEHVEQECRSRWAEIFVSNDAPTQHERAA